MLLFTLLYVGFDGRPRLKHATCWVAARNKAPTLNHVCTYSDLLLGGQKQEASSLGTSWRAAQVLCLARLGLGLGHGRGAAQLPRQCIKVRLASYSSHNDRFGLTHILYRPHQGISTARWDVHSIVPLDSPFHSATGITIALVVATLLAPSSVTSCQTFVQYVYRLPQVRARGHPEVEGVGCLPTPGTPAKSGTHAPDGYRD